MYLVKGYHCRVHHVTQNIIKLRLSRKPYYFKITKRTHNKGKYHKHGEATVLCRNGKAVLFITDKVEKSRTEARRAQIGRRPVINFWTVKPEISKLLEVALRAKPNNHGITMKINMQKEVD